MKLIGSFNGRRSGRFDDTKYFTNIAGSNYYPQVFIPFYDQLKDAGKIDTEDPIIVIAVEDKDEYPAYVRDISGEIVDAGFLVDEAYAREHEVWVIAINERVDDNGDVIDAIGEDSQPARTKGASYPDAQIYQMKVVTHNESWASGGSEVNIHRFKSFYSYTTYTSELRLEGLTTEDAPGNDGWRIRTFSRSEINNKKLCVFTWTLISNWPDQTIDIDPTAGVDLVHTPYLYYVIFEYDAWPTGLRNVNIWDAANQNPFPDSYRSADTYYAVGYLSTYDADNSNILQGGINAYVRY